MTLSLRGRLETRLFLTLFVALPAVLLFAALSPAGDGRLAALGAALSVVALMGGLGLGWELVYHSLQQLRADRDWPSLLALLAIGLEIGPLWWVCGRLVERPAAGHFLAAVFGAWVLSWLFVQGPMRVVFLRWRLSGGRLLCGR